jgi:hypothetical protein
MRRPPQCVAFVARVHWTVGAIVVVSTALVHWATHDLPRIEFGPRTFFTAGGLAAAYLLAGTLVWFGAPFGPLLSRVCALLYLPRPRFGLMIWDTMNSPEFRAHFDRRDGRQ